MKYVPNSDFTVPVRNEHRMTEEAIEMLEECGLPDAKELLKMGFLLATMYAGKTLSEGDMVELAIFMASNQDFNPHDNGPVLSVFIDMKETYGESIAIEILDERSASFQKRVDELWFLKKFLKKNRTEITS